MSFVWTYIALVLGDNYVLSTTQTPSLSLPTRLRKPFFCKVERSRSMVRWLTDNISDIWRPVIVGDSLMRLMIFSWRTVIFVSDFLGIGRGKDYGLELSWRWFELRLQLVFIPFQCFCLIADACETATSFLHIVKLSHHVCKYGIAPFGVLLFLEMETQKGCFANKI